jgi:hypothetical protein
MVSEPIATARLVLQPVSRAATAALVHGEPAARAVGPTPGDGWPQEDTLDNVPSRRVLERAGLRREHEGEHQARYALQRGDP